MTCDCTVCNTFGDLVLEPILKDELEQMLVNDFIDSIELLFGIIQDDYLPMYPWQDDA